MCVTVCLGGHNADCNGTEVCRLVPDADLEGLSRQKPQDQDRHPNRQAAEHETCRVSVDISLFFLWGEMFRTRLIHLRPVVKKFIAYEKGKLNL